MPKAKIVPIINANAKKIDLLMGDPNSITLKDPKRTFSPKSEEHVQLNLVDFREKERIKAIFSTDIRY